jgi:hypothetical protein
VTLAGIGELVKRWEGEDADQIWREVEAAIESKGRAVPAEVRRLVILRQRISSEQAVVLVQANVGPGKCHLDFLQRATARVREGLPPDCKHFKALKAALPKCPILI